MKLAHVKMKQDVLFGIFVLCMSLSDALRIENTSYRRTSDVQSAPFVPVFTPGEGGYPCIRIPSILLSNDGHTLLAFAEVSSTCACVLDSVKEKAGRRSSCRSLISLSSVATGLEMAVSLGCLATTRTGISV